MRLHAIHLCLAALLVSMTGHTDEGRYEVLFENGETITGNRISHDAHLVQGESRARLDGQPLFAHGKPVKRIRDRHRQSSLTDGYLGMANGDVLPGRITAVHEADYDQNLPRVFEVEPASPLGVFDKAKRTTVRVVADQVTRIVFDPPGHREERPGTVRLRDNQILEVRAVRWRNGGAHLLTSEDVQNVDLTDLLEWQARVLRKPEAAIADLLSVPAGIPGRIVRIHALNGAVFTTYEARLSRFKDNRIIVQPAWAVDPVTTDLADITVVRYDPIDAIPLTVFPSETLEERSYTGYKWPWRRNRSVQGNILAVGTVECLYGVGAHSYSAVAFELPVSALHLSGQVGIHRLAKGGGCATVSIHGGSLDHEPLWKRPFLRGLDGPTSYEKVPLNSVKKVILQTDFAHQDRPAGADPFDIRDEVDWLDPMVTVDLPSLRRDSKPWPSSFACLNEWVLVEPPMTEARRGAAWDNVRGGWVPTIEFGPEPMSPLRNWGKAPGLSYELFKEFHGTKLPDFNSMAASSTGTVRRCTLEIRNLPKTHFALRMTSALLVPRDGVYEFYLPSSDGSKLFLDDQLVIDNDGIHTWREGRNRIRLQTGPVRFRLEYFQHTDNRYAAVYWRGPGIAKEVIPSQSFDRSPNLSLRKLEPDFATLPPYEPAHQLVMRRTLKVSSSNTWLLAKFARSETAFGDYEMTVDIDGTSYAPMSSGGNTTHGRSSMDLTRTAWDLGAFAGENIDIKLKVKAFGYAGEPRPGLYLNRFGVGSPPPSQIAPAEAKDWIGTWWLKAAASSVIMRYHRGAMNGSHGKLVLAPDGTHRLNLLFTHGMRQSAVGYYASLNDRMILDFHDSRWNDDSMTLSDDRQQLFVRGVKSPESWKLEFSRERPKAAGSWSGVWSLEAGKTAVSNKIHTGGLKAGNGRMSIADDGSIGIALNYPGGAGSVALGTCKPEKEGMRFHYFDDDWNDDIGMMEADGKTITLREIGNEAKWSLIFTRTDGL